MDKDKSLELLKKYNNDIFHIKHGKHVQYVMEYIAKELGFSEDAEYWGLVGLLHDIDFEKYPDEHCVKCQEILENECYDQSFINSIKSHGYGICSDIKPTHIMEKVLYAT
ncbi:MAG: HDIG domain-containing metalloprotein [Oscillospiraceae bacterium]